MDRLEKNTSINFLNNRRKPSRTDFNQYYNILKDNLQSESFTNVELFNELNYDETSINELTFFSEPFPFSCRSV